MTTAKPWPDFNPHHPSRFAEAVHHINLCLADNRPHPWNEIVAIATAMGLTYKTADNIVRNMIRTGTLIRTGHYNRRTRQDNRTLRLAGSR